MLKKLSIYPLQLCLAPANLNHGGVILVQKEGRMKSITIHGLEDPLDSLIREKAKKQGLSLNKTIKNLLAESLGITPKSDESRKKDFLDLFGTWSQEEARAFTARTADLEKIDPEDWS
jgi:hypothetical protein